MVKVYAGIGSNLEDRENNIEAAIGMLNKKCRVLKISSLYETEPVGYKEQGWFLNCALEIETNLKPEELLKFFHSIEKSLGRKKTIKNGPRTMDLDILFYGDQIIKTKRLDVPHPRLHGRMFVLMPLDELCPDFMHPKLKKSVRFLKDNLKGKDAVILLEKQKFK